MSGECLICASRPTGPSWLPVKIQILNGILPVYLNGKYLHEGKEVVAISGSSVYGIRSTIHYADGSILTESSAGEGTDHPTYRKWNHLIKQFGFTKYYRWEHDRYYQGELFEAVPKEDPSEWEKFDTRPHGSGLMESGQSGWRRKR